MNIGKAGQSEVFLGVCAGLHSDGKALPKEERTVYSADIAKLTPLFATDQTPKLQYWGSRRKTGRHWQWSPRRMRKNEFCDIHKHR